MRETRLELAQLAPLAPQASVSTNSTTPAGVLHYNATKITISKTGFSVNPVTRLFYEYDDTFFFSFFDVCMRKRMASAFFAQYELFGYASRLTAFNL